MIALETRPQSWELREPFATARDCLTHVQVLQVELTGRGGARGRAEAAGVDYSGETPASMAAQLAGIQARLHDELTGEELLELLPAGGARNALDCALWDLRAKETGVSAAATAGFQVLHPVTTAFTIGLGSESDTRRRARAAEQALGVELIEQPVARAQDESLDGLAAGVPLAADESCTDRRSLQALAGRYQYINIKLDKCGGLTEALALRTEALRRGFGLMVGNMCGSSLAMAPAFLIAQQCRYVDLDGPLLQRLDYSPAIRFEHGLMHAPRRELWG